LLFGRDVDGLRDNVGTAFAPVGGDTLDLSAWISAITRRACWAWKQATIASPMP